MAQGGTRAKTLAKNRMSTLDRSNPCAEPYRHRSSVVTKLIENKRDGKELELAEFRFLVDSHLRNSLPKHQTAALLMAIYFRGLSCDETAALTKVMLESGSRIHFPPDPRALVDRHSTGGVGDKCSMIVGPILAALEFRAPTITVQGAGHAGGTLDKMRAIPGVCVELTSQRFVEIVQDVGCAISGPTGELVPADRELFQLRTETGTVPSPGLIVSSILSKKLAASLSALVVDVKFGSGSLVGTKRQAIGLAHLLKEVAKTNQLHCGCLITNMETPIGSSIGRWLEVREATQFLTEAQDPDLMEIVGKTVGLILLITGRERTMRRALLTVKRILDSGKPLEHWRRMLAAQGADLKEFDQLQSRDSLAAYVRFSIEQHSAFHQAISIPRNILLGLVKRLPAAQSSL